MRSWWGTSAGAALLRRRLAAALLLAGLAGAAPAQAQSPAERTAQMRPPARTTAEPQPTAARPLRLGVVSFYNPRLMYLKYQPLVDYLSERSGQPWELVISPAYQDTVDKLCAGELTLAYLGPVTYVRAHEQCGALPVVRLETGGRDSYRSYVMVRDGSAFTSLSQLKGQRFGFGSVLSTSSHLVPRVMLAQAGVDPHNLDCRYFRHHERAARAVLLGEVEACGIRDIVGEKFRRRGLRLLAASDPIPNFPLVVGPTCAGELQEALVELLVKVPQREPAVARRFAAWDEELARGFAPARDAEYDGVRRWMRALFGPLALGLPEAQLACGGRSR